MLRDNLRRIYRHVPGKQLLFELIRKAATPPERIWRHLWFDGVFETRYRGTTFKLFHSGHIVENSVFWGGIEGPWEGYTMSLWADLARRSQYVADIGANTGLFAVLAQAMNPDARVAGFEPNPEFLEPFKRSVEANSMPIRVEQRGLSSKEGIINFSGFEVLRDDDPRGRMKVPMMRFDAFVAEAGWERIDLAKIDVERHEPEVLEGFGNLLKRDRPSLIIEVLDDEVGRLIEARLPSGYLFFNIDDRSRSLKRTTHLGQHSDRNVLACTQETATALGLPD